MSSQEQKYDFVLGDYKKEFWYWEVRRHTQYGLSSAPHSSDLACDALKVVELFRKLILAGGIGLVQRGSIAQTMLATLISFFFFAAAVRAQPFENPRLNAIKVFSEFQL